MPLDPVALHLETAPPIVAIGAGGSIPRPVRTGKTITPALHTVRPWAAAELALWTGVVMQAIGDACSDRQAEGEALCRRQARARLQGGHGLADVLAMLDVDHTLAERAEARESATVMRTS